jgi:uncharacterized membrane protein
VSAERGRWGRGGWLTARHGPGELEFARIVAFSDGVIAIAITLLVLTLEVPDVSADELPSALADMWRSYVAFALSFALIGRFWIIHHRTFAAIARFDAVLMTLNLVVLALIVLMPFATDLVSEYEENPIGVALYASVIAGAGIVNWAMMRHAWRSGHVLESHRAEARVGGSWRALAPSAVFVCSIPFVFISSDLAVILWALALVPGLRPRRPLPEEPGGQAPAA